MSDLKTKFEQGKRDLRSSTPRAIADGLEQIDLLVAREVLTSTVMRHICIALLLYYAV
jgi:hypothetical protein